MASIESGFRNALTKFKSTLTPTMADDFGFTTLEDVYRAVLTIQEQQAKKKEMMNVTRIRSFLEAMDSFGKVIEVFFKHLGVCGIHMGTNEIPTPGISPQSQCFDQLSTRTHDHVFCLISL